MKLRSLGRWAALALPFAISLFGPVAERTARADDAPIAVDRILAVVDDRVITLLEVRARMAPLEKQLSPGDPEYAKKRDIILRGILARCIDERLVQKAADKLRMSVTNEEVDTAISYIAKDSSISPAELEKLVKQQGLTMPEYKQEIRRQVLEAKYLRLVMANDPVKKLTTDAEKLDWMNKRREEALAKLREDAFIDIRL